MRGAWLAAGSSDLHKRVAPSRVRVAERVAVLEAARFVRRTGAGPGGAGAGAGAGEDQHPPPVRRENHIAAAQSHSFLRAQRSVVQAGEERGQLRPGLADFGEDGVLLHRRLRFGHSGAPAGLGGTDDRLPWVHPVAHGVPAGHRQRPHRRRPRRRRYAAEAGREVVLGLRRRRTSPRRDDLEGRDLGEEGHRPGHAADRRDRAPAGSRGCGREQAVLR